MKKDKKFNRYDRYDRYAASIPTLAAHRQPGIATGISAALSQNPPSLPACAPQDARPSGVLRGAGTGSPAELLESLRYHAMR
jgi:hypothetical protein